MRMVTNQCLQSFASSGFIYAAPSGFLVQLHNSYGTETTLRGFAVLVVRGSSPSHVVSAALRTGSAEVRWSLFPPLCRVALCAPQIRTRNSTYINCCGVQHIYEIYGRTYFCTSTGLSLEIARHSECHKHQRHARS